jgi:FkbM family methyltransferase
LADHVGDRNERERSGVKQAETPQPRLLWAHKAAIWGIGKLPHFNNHMLFRAYDKAIRLFRQEHIGKTYFGALMHCNLSDWIQLHIFHFGVWEPEISYIVSRILKPDDVFVDIGANVGYDSLLGSSLVGPQGRVIAIEPSPTTFAKLKENIALNKSTNVRAVNVAVSDSVGTLDLFDVSESNCGAATTLAGRGGKLIATVNALPLAQILTPSEMGSVRLIKIDVEGAEPIILNDVLDHIEHFPTSMDIIVESSPDEFEDSKRVFSRMMQMGYYAYAIDNVYEWGRYLSNRPLSPLVSIDTLPLTQCDLLYTRRKIVEVALKKQLSV